MLLLIYWTNVLSGDHIKEYYQAMSLLWMSPVMETVSFMHASPNSRVVWALRWNKQVLWGIIWWITSFSMVPIFIRFTTRHAINRSLMPILLFKVCALSIKFASVFFRKKQFIRSVWTTLFFDISMSELTLGPMPLWHGAASPFYMPPPFLF